ncbi:hypothetical protein [Paenibacillus sp. HB172176]|uniref:hypothetical protein n=1 Tax=Paenibacillus sp. HB172176 TaxID=2493690 RepID=UPI001438D7AF|nr:hypothetical protein [Paenibacillus sp. HB172176]
MNVLKNKFVKAASLSLVSLFLLQCFSVTAFANTSAVVTVDYDVDVGPSNNVASGFLHGIDDISPAQYLIDGVHVKTIRGADSYNYLPSLFDLTTYNRVKATGADIMVGLYYRARAINLWPVDAATEAQWEGIIEDIYNEAQTKNLDIKSWITWNEPDLQWNSAPTTFAKFERAHEVAYKKMKALDSAALVQGPELAGYNYSKMTDFLSYCKLNDCLPDILSWHELGSSVNDIEGHTAQIKTWMLANGITPMPIAITEYQGQSYSSSSTVTSYPGLNVLYLARLERSVPNGLAYALHASWQYKGTNPDFKASLGDSANRDSSLLPKGLWWVYNGYKDMTGRLVETVSSNNHSDAIASFDSDMGRSVILLGTPNTSTPHDPVVQLNHIPAELKYGNKTHIKAEKIVDANILMAPEVVIDADYTVVSDSVTLNLATQDPKAAYRIYITSATDDAPKTSYEAENLTATATSGVTLRTFTEASASGGVALSLDATATDQSVTITMNVPAAGTYQLGAILKKAPDRGFFQLYMDGVAYGSPKDGYSGSYTYFSTDFGAIKFDTAGNHDFEFRTVGKNNSSSSYRVVIDKLELTEMN